MRARRRPTGGGAETPNDRRMREVTPAGQHGPVDPTVLAAALSAARGACEPVLGGMLVVGADGLVQAADSCGAQVEMLGVMAAAVAGIASQIATQAEVGETVACLIEGSAGHVAVFPLEPEMVLVVGGQGEVSTGRFNLAARRVLSHVRRAIAGVSVVDTGEASAIEEAVEKPLVFEPVNRVPHVRFRLGP